MHRFGIRLVNSNNGVAARYQRILTLGIQIPIDVQLPLGHREQSSNGRIISHLTNIVSRNIGVFGIDDDCCFIRPLVIRVFRCTVILGENTVCCTLWILSEICGDVNNKILTFNSKLAALPSPKTDGIRTLRGNVDVLSI